MKAFPSRIEHSDREGGVGLVVQHEGMDLRDWFAGQALAGMAREQIKSETNMKLYAGWMAEAAYQLADAMMEVRGE